MIRSRGKAIPPSLFCLGRFIERLRKEIPDTDLSTAGPFFNKQEVGDGVHEA